MKSSRRGGSFVGFLVVLALGGLLGAGVCYLVLREAQAADAAPPPEKPSTPASESTEDYIARKLREWNLTPEDLKRDLATAGRIAREKGRELGDKVKAATADVTIIAKIKGKYALDEKISALAIVFDCKEGHVKLSGTVASSDLIGRAIVLALDTDGVIDVVSSIKVENRPEPV